MKIQEFRLINANKSLESTNIESLEAHFNDLTTKVNPKDSQCIAINGRIILEGEYHPDAIVMYKVPGKKVDYEIDKFPEHLQDKVIQLKAELNLTKEQIKQLKKTVNALDLKVIEIEKQCEIIKNKAIELKKESNMKKVINNFNRRYSDFNECLLSNLEMLDRETKTEIRKKLSVLKQVIDDTIESYLQ